MDLYPTSVSPLAHHTMPMNGWLTEWANEWTTISQWLNIGCLDGCLIKAAAEWLTARSIVCPFILPSVHAFACPDESGHLSKQCKMKFILLSILRFDSFTELGRPQCNFEAFSSYSPARSFVRPALHSRIPSQTFAYQTQTIGWKWRYSWFCGD